MVLMRCLGEINNLNFKMKKAMLKLTTGMIMLISLLIILSLFLVSAQTPQVKYCCEKTNFGAWCQEAPQSECNTAFRSVPTSCEATSFCKLGCCYDSNEGICMESTPQKVCQDKNGTWADSKECEIPQCKLGCCVLGKQASFVSLTRCKKLSGFYGLMTDFRQNIGTEFDCIAIASLEDEGACVYELDYAKTCQFTSRQGCNSIKEGTKTENGTITGNIAFYKEYLCSSEELATNCGLTKETTCVDGKDEVYFIDSCGNPANIYDSSKVNDKSYWRKKINKTESCNLSSSNGNSKICGNCNYFEGSICSKKKPEDAKPVYGNNLCKSLDCAKTTLGKSMKHGESWCSTDKNVDAVGSRYFRHLCMNGEEIIEPCSDFRQETCIQDKITTSKGDFSQAACRVNRWQDCYSQGSEQDCKNVDRRDCKWLQGKCYPQHPPGFKFWESGEGQGLCAQANTQCVVEFEKKGFFFSGDKKCIKNCECLNPSWQDQQMQKCVAIADCGNKVNFVGVKGFKLGASIKTESVKDSKEGKGGLFG